MAIRETGTPSQMINIGAPTNAIKLDLDVSVDVVTSLGLVIMGRAAKNCLARVRIESDTPGAINSIGDLFEAASGNRFEVESHTLTNLDTSIGSLRVIEEDRANAYNNMLLFCDLATGRKLETFRNGLALLELSKEVQLTATPERGAR
ncbi:hypothetical protein [Methylocella sp.]|uniref:hypothetical protein n=1 Tax=Methylocella sp. TaxID=1978226 RepID=UPI0035B25365